MSSQAFITVLAVIAAWVSARQIRHGDRKTGVTWALICAYWIVLTLKNVFELFY